MRFEPIQHLRGFAAIYVLLFHLGIRFDIDLFRFGHKGVPLFFAISGFIIAYVHERDVGSSKVREYFLKRASRIFPPYWASYLLFLVLILAAGMGSSLHREPSNIFLNFFLIQPPSQSILPVAWTLVFELYFYVMFGIFYVLLRMPGVVFCALLALPPVTVLLLGLNFGKDHLWFSPMILLFVGGALLGFYSRVLPTLNVGWLYIAFLLGFLACPFFEAPWYVEHLAIMLCVAAAVSSTAKSAFLRFLGDSSYSIYLTHIIWIAVFAAIIPDRGMLAFLLFFAVALCLCILFYILCEKPLTEFIRTNLLPRVIRSGRKNL